MSECLVQFHWCPSFFQACKKVLWYFGTWSKLYRYYAPKVCHRRPILSQWFFQIPTQNFIMPTSLNLKSSRNCLVTWSADTWHCEEQILNYSDPLYTGFDVNCDLWNGKNGCKEEMICKWGFDVSDFLQDACSGTRKACRCSAWPLSRFARRGGRVWPSPGRRLWELLVSRDAVPSCCVYLNCREAHLWCNVRMTP